MQGGSNLERSSKAVLWLMWLTTELPAPVTLQGGPSAFQNGPSRDLLCVSLSGLGWKSNPWQDLSSYASDHWGSRVFACRGGGVDRALKIGGYRKRDFTGPPRRADSKNPKYDKKKTFFAIF